MAALGMACVRCLQWVGWQQESEMALESGIAHTSVTEMAMDGMLET